MSALRRVTVYMLLTTAKAHAYPSWARMTQVRLRAERMGVQAEALTATTNGRRATKTTREVEGEMLRLAEAKSSRCARCARWAIDVEAAS